MQKRVDSATMATVMEQKYTLKVEQSSTASPQSWVSSKRKMVWPKYTNSSPSEQTKTSKVLKRAIRSPVLYGMQMTSMQASPSTMRGIPWMMYGTPRCSSLYFAPVRRKLMPARISTTPRTTVAEVKSRQPANLLVFLFTKHIKLLV